MEFDQTDTTCRMDGMASNASLGQKMMPAMLDSAAKAESFNFDTWSALARLDPAAFEEARRIALDQVIATADNKEQLQCLQWRVDGERFRAKTPLKACLRLSSMMWDKFADMRSALTLLTTVCEVNPPWIRLVSAKGSTPTSFSRPAAPIKTTFFPRLIASGDSTDILGGECVRKKTPNSSGKTIAALAVPQPQFSIELPTRSADIQANQDWIQRIVPAE